jgi:short subunit dehydrogenase-like uncharacterized protein
MFKAFLLPQAAGERKGVLTPATAFRGTDLIDRLQNNGISFTIIDLKKD